MGEMLPLRQPSAGEMAGDLSRKGKLFGVGEAFDPYGLGADQLAHGQAKQTRCRTGGHDHFRTNGKYEPGTLPKAFDGFERPVAIAIADDPAVGHVGLLEKLSFSRYEEDVHLGKGFAD